MMATFSDMVERTIELFMDDLSVLGKSFDNFLENLSDSCHGRVSGINNIFFPIFLLLP